MTPTTERDFFREISDAQFALNVERDKQRHKDGSICAWELEDVPPSEKELGLEKRLHQLEEERARNFDALATPLLAELKTVISKYPQVKFSVFHCPDIGGLDVIWSNGPPASEIETVLEKYRSRNLFPWAYRYRHCPQCRKEWPELKGPSSLSRIRGAARTSEKTNSSR
jgi:hypothetical protein